MLYSLVGGLLGGVAVMVWWVFPSLLHQIPSEFLNLTSNVHLNILHKSWQYLISVLILPLSQSLQVILLDLVNLPLEFLLLLGSHV